MDKLIIIYHGSENIIAKPEYGKGRLNNDFGQGLSDLCHTPVLL